MEKNEFAALLAAVFEKNGMQGLLNERASDLFFALFTSLTDENTRHNLTAITEPKQVILRHFADSCALCRYLPPNAVLLDVGCGAGFPTLPLAVCRPDLHITALDATQKKVQYVAETAKALGLSSVTAICGRAEELAKTARRESFSFVTARAVADLPVLCELCLPFVSLGGSFFAMKGRSGEEELEKARRAIGTLGGRVQKCESFSLVGEDETLDRTYFEIRKEKPTAPAYPRPFARILKKPL